MRTNTEENSDYYDQEILCVSSVNGGEARLLSKKLDRPVYVHRWAADGKTITCLVEDDIETYLASFSLSTGEVTKVAGGERTFMVAEPRKGGGWAALIAEPQVPGEIYAVQPGKIAKLTHVNDEFIDSLSLARVVKYQSKSKDGTLVSGLLYYPPTGDTTKLPLVFFIHGGPVGQDEYGFDQTCQMIAADGFAVANVNYRGSSGRGLKYSKVISGNWGDLEVMDILGAADHLVAKGVADPKRLGIGGWSYGGILTDYTIASDRRFAAACSGAGSAAPLSLYGVDMYIGQYEYELGQPWIKGSLDRYLKMSYPLLHADRIKTPTLFLGGEKDFNVPLMGGEQMYQALRALDVPTELVIYPGQFHSFTQPSFIMDRYERYRQWFTKYLKQ
jgi:dipeptidyl aminopeptidase/acylaminoacyl peptidase